MKRGVLESSGLRLISSIGKTKRIISLFFQRRHCFFKKILEFKKYNFFAKKEEEKNALLLVLPFKDISLRPELSSTPRFRIQGGTVSVTADGRTKDGNCDV